MTQKRSQSKKKKLSPGFVSRLDALGPRDKVRAIVLLRPGTGGRTTGGRQSRAEREATAEAMRRSAEQALEDIDEILAKFDGQRLARRPDALGSVPVETTAAGIKALASSRWVRAVLEDQEIHLIP